MVATDRIFRALGRTNPEALVDLARLFAPGAIPPDARITPASVDDPHLDAPPPPLHADWIARLDERELLHFECQGYRDSDFPDRVFDYHLRLVVRYASFRVRTIALWLIEPPEEQTLEVITRGDVQIRITSLVLPRLSAAALLTTPLTACFAPGADAGDWSAAELCARVARALRESNAGWHARQMACVVAAIRGRYKEMVKAMKQENIEQVLSIELIQILKDLEYEKARLRGLADGLLAAYEARFSAVPPEHRAAIEAIDDEATLRGLFRVIAAGSADDVASALRAARPA
jgi:hypothetical protein